MNSMQSRHTLYNKLLSPVLLFGLALAPSARAQLGTGSIEGTIRDPSGAVLPSAIVRATKVDTGVKTPATTTKTGDYSFPSLPVGSYTLSVEAQGFRQEQKENIRVITGETLSVDFDLKIGSSAQVITVNGAAPLVDTTSSTVGATLTLQEVADLPVEENGRNRNPSDLLQTFPGVNFIPSTNNDTSVINGIGDGGGFNEFSSYRVDGIDGSSQPTQSLSDSGALSPDVVSEFRVVTDTNAESGEDMGSSIEVVTKSGTNTYHGSLYEYDRNNAFDSKNYFATSVSTYKQHEFAGVLGGPIVRDKDFFLVSLGEYIIRNAASGIIATVPTAQMRTGDFSQFLGTGEGTIYDPDTNTQTPNGVARQPFPGNVIPASRMSPVSAYFLQGYPKPNLPGLENNWEGTAIPDNLNKVNMYVKTDHVFGTHQRLSFGWEYNPYWSSDGCVSIYGNALAGWGPQTLGCSTETIHSYRVRFNYAWQLSDSMILSARAGMNGDPTTSGANTGRSTEGQKAGLSGYYNPGLPQVTIDSTQGFGINQGPLFVGRRVIPIYVDLSKRTGNHQIKFGVQPTIMTFPDSSQLFAEIDFSQLLTAQPGVANTGWGFASFLLGDVYSVSAPSPEIVNYSSSSLGLFAQDQWRVTPKLTINYGLRYDLFLSPEERNGNTSFFDPTIPNPGANNLLGALTFWGDGPGRNGRSRILDTDPRVFSPRLGVAYAWKPQLVTRVYYGIDRNPLAWILYGGTGAPAYGSNADVAATSTDAGVTPVYNWTNPFPFPLPTLPDLNPALENGQTISYTNPAADHPGLDQNFGLGNELNIGRGLVLSVDYVGKLISKMPTAGMVDLNQLDVKYYALGSLLLDPVTSSAAQQARIPLPYPGFTGSVAQALRPYPQYNEIDYIDSMTRAVLYNAVNMSVQKHFGNGFNFLAAYTISKQLTNDQSSGCVYFACAAAPTAVQVTGQSTWGPTSVDTPQIFTASYVYQLPFGPGKPWLNQTNPFVNSLVGGWQIAGIQTYSSGNPVHVTTSSAIPTVNAVWADIVPGEREKLISCGSYLPGSSHYLNIAAFTSPAPYTLGTANYLPNIRGCPNLNEDLSATKSLPIRDAWSLKVGADFFNVFNRHEWSGLEANVDDPLTFGTFTSASNPRSIQLWGRITF